MDISSPTTKDELRHFIDLRFANGQWETVYYVEGQLDVDSLHVTITGATETIQHDRGGAGVVGYRLWTTLIKVPLGSPLA